MREIERGTDGWTDSLSQKDREIDGGKQPVDAASSPPVSTTPALPVGTLNGLEAVAVSPLICTRKLCKRSSPLVTLSNQFLMDKLECASTLDSMELDSGHW